jgi:hypothetical protein
MGIKGSPTCEVHFEDCRIPGDRMIGAPGTGFKTALATLDHTRLTIAAQAVGIAQGSLDAAIAYTKERRQFGQRGQRLPGRAVHARRHGHEDRGRPPAGVRRRGQGRPRRGRPHLRLGGREVLRLRHRDAGRGRRRAAVRRSRVHRRLPGAVGAGARHHRHRRVGKSSLTDELVRRFRLDQEDKLRIAVLAVDPTRRKGGGALLATASA